MLHRMFALIATLLCLFALAFAWLLWATRVPPQVPVTVTGDAVLSRLHGEGVLLHGRVTGAEDAPLVVVLHGGPGGDHRSLLALEGLSDTRRVLFYDQRGAGLSERVAEDRLRVADHLADLDTLIAAHGGGSVVLIGHSWGAMLATAYLGHRPDAISRAVLIEPGFLDAEGLAAFETRRAALSRSPRVIWAGLLAGFRARAVTGDAEAARDSIVQTVVHAFANHPANPYHCPGQAYDAPAWRFGSHASDSFWRDPTPALDAMTLGLSYAGPVLILAGGCNDWTGAPLQARHAAMFPDARMEVIESAGHDTVWDQPEATLAVIKSFLAAPPGPGAGDR
ncbi:hydrolase [Pseudooceanicola batsensis HTCC2597]|uniref:Hydrolase n=1 Tax=Pseudooceanicola batsensis (strain ATCC BAA-863 / DSM 15984 / KCTC 12145 / HTCC2597) TaxID=252305 RepID=A3TUD7_PSEBH|nr:alpha/beta hydrolase [Pseudooceanicola batsensis]EAQ04133.1 hydrolase [Pseudooceanicola batsensis HTCC2597]